MSTFLKRLISIMFLLILTGSGLYFASGILEEKHRSMQTDTFYDLPENSVDALFIGSSQYVRSIASNVIYMETGISSFNRSSELLSAQNQYLYVLDSFKTQSPKVVFLSAARLQNGYNDKRDMHFHFGLTKIKTGLDKLKLAVNYQNESNTMKALDIMLPVFKYHYRWNELEYRDFLNYSNIETGGQDAYWNIYHFDSDEENFYGRIETDRVREASYDPIVKKYLDKSIEYCKAQGAQVVICDLPSKSWNQEKHTAAKAVAEEHGVEFLDCNLDENLDKIGDDLKTDWHDDHAHMNGWGSYKMASFIGSYLEDNFHLTDYRHSENFISSKLNANYEEYFFRYQMFLPEELTKPEEYDLDNVKKMNNIPKLTSEEIAATNISYDNPDEVYTKFEELLTEYDFDFKYDHINVEEAKGKSGKRYTFSNGINILLVEYNYDSYGHVLASHNRVLDFSGHGEFPIVDPVSKSGYIMAIDGTTTKEQAMLLTDIYYSLEK